MQVRLIVRILFRQSLMKPYKTTALDSLHATGGQEDRMSPNQKAMFLGSVRQTARDWKGWSREKGVLLLSQTNSYSNTPPWLLPQCHRKLLSPSQSLQGHPACIVMPYRSERLTSTGKPPTGMPY